MCVLSLHQAMVTAPRTLPHPPPRGTSGPTSTPLAVLRATDLPAERLSYPGRRSPIRQDHRRRADRRLGPGRTRPLPGRTQGLRHQHPTQAMTGQQVVAAHHDLPGRRSFRMATFRPRCPPGLPPATWRHRAHLTIVLTALADHARHRLNLPEQQQDRYKHCGCSAPRRSPSDAADQRAISIPPGRTRPRRPRSRWALTLEPDTTRLMKRTPTGSSIPRMQSSSP